MLLSARGFLAILAGLLGTVRAVTDSDSQWRLPRSILPLSYKLRLLPFLEEGNFTSPGSVDITVECHNDTNELLIHSADIAVDLNSVQVTELPSQRTVPIGTVDEDKNRQFLRIVLRDGTLFTAGTTYVVSIKFVTELNDVLRGFYRASYVEDGQKRYMATTQFSPIDARRAFPCFDEPGFKASFQITIGRKETMKATSNMPVSSTVPNEDLPGYVWDIFEPTLPMSTYIVAFIVSDFAGVPAPRLPGETKFTIWSRPSAVNQTEYARHIGPSILRFFAEYLNVSFPLPKQDMFAIPDFAVGAMENWGLVTYRESSLLYDPRKSSAVNRQRVAAVVAHELAHQWFGNLVTMHFWSDVWLKEGLASYMEFVGVPAVEPGMELMDQFVTEDLQPALLLDALSTSKPMSFPVRKPSEINEVFDPIAYQKGPSVIRMLASFLGEPILRRGMARYLNSLKYKNAFQDDLWNAFNDQALEDGLELPSDVDTIMKTWSLQAGFPLVSVVRDYAAGEARVCQERFLLDRGNISSTRWWIPLTFTSNFDDEPRADWLAQGEDCKTIGHLYIKGNQWVIINVNQTGYYRVNYDLNNWKLILDQLLEDHARIGTVNRAQIVDDSLNLARAGLLNYSVALEISKYLEKERHYTPWKSALTALEFLKGILLGTSAEDDFRDYVKRIVEPLYQSIGFEEKQDDSHLKILLRAEMLKWACGLGMEDCVRNAKDLLAQWMADPHSEDIISANLLRTVSCTAVAKGDQSAWDFVFQKYLQSNIASEKDTFLNALSCSRDVQALNRLLEWSLDKNSPVRRQDAFAVFQNVAANPVGRSVALDFLIARWPDMTKSFPSLYVLSRIVDSVTKILNTERQLNQLKELRETHKGGLGNAERSVNQAIERTQSNLNWIDNHFDQVSSWLHANIKA